MRFPSPGEVSPKGFLQLVLRTLWPAGEQEQILLAAFRAENFAPLAEYGRFPIGSFVLWAVR